MNGKIQITVNGKPFTLHAPLDAMALWERQAPAKMPDIMVVNGFPVLSGERGRPLRDGDSVVFIRRGEIPSETEFMSMLTARNTPGLQTRFQEAVVGIAGLGGLGSHVATALARTGIGCLVLADFDVVEPSNLNRQCYDVADIGKYKTDALAEQISRFNPYLRIVKHRIRLNGENVFDIFSNCNVVVEAFDSVAGKKMLVNAFGSSAFRSQFLVTASGLAGIASPNLIQTRKLTRNVYLCGDLVSAAEPGRGLMAPRVMVAAGHQATMVLRILAGIAE